ncbi:uncharacterized protein N7518_002315 [Penicillium psychrosexuale]|uniref:uncharacterized protein n=1 Tax=Penicillium psychrosexuale TaxID=1002107 RepID=UPI0025458200|nr:uncharacterized protein N7518_002315 [Penicillium psychrosexuale]KAJ5800247.1 hypothetical protein N7518_002315 [Penicillium psychrosexuale]
MTFPTVCVSPGVPRHADRVTFCLYGFKQSPCSTYNLKIGGRGKNIRKYSVKDWSMAHKDKFDYGYWWFGTWRHLSICNEERHGITELQVS